MALFNAIGTPSIRCDSLCPPKRCELPAARRMATGFGDTVRGATMNASVKAVMNAAMIETLNQAADERGGD